MKDPCDRHRLVAELIRVELPAELSPRTFCISRASCRPSAKTLAARRGVVSDKTEMSESDWLKEHVWKANSQTVATDAPVPGRCGVAPWSGRAETHSTVLVSKGF